MAFTEVQYQKLLLDPKFKALVDKYGKPKAGPKTCDELKPGDICMETECVNGMHLVMKCNDGQCTDYSEEKCP